MTGLVRFSCLFTAAFVVIGIGSLNQSIEEIWKWMQLALLPSILIPNMLRWYWWRMNGWGFTIDAFTGAVQGRQLIPYLSASVFSTCLTSCPVTSTVMMPFGLPSRRDSQKSRREFQFISMAVSNACELTVVGIKLNAVAMPHR